MRSFMWGSAEVAMAISVLSVGQMASEEGVRCVQLFASGVVSVLASMKLG